MRSSESGKAKRLGGVSFPSSRAARSTMSNQPLVSVITVVRNGEQTIERAIKSVVEQTYERIEYLVLDGGSTDGTVDLIRKYERRIAYWRSEPDGGIYDAMNKAIEIATGDWIHLLNADDFYADSDVWARVICRLDPARVNYFAMIQRLKSGEERRYRFPYRFWRLYYSAYLPHPALVVHHTQYAAVGKYSTSYKIAADHDMILRLVRRYHANFIDIPFVFMSLGGFSSRYPELALREVERITVTHGLPWALARAFYLVKVARLKSRKLQRQRRAS